MSTSEVVSTTNDSNNILDFEGYPDEQYQIAVYSNAASLIPITDKDYSILDIGCASGRFPILLNQLLPDFQNIRYTGIDRNPNAIKYAKNHIWAGYNEGNISFRTEDVITWAKDVQTPFDYCFMNSIFHIPEQEDMRTYMELMVDLTYHHLTRKGLAFNFYWPMGNENPDHTTFEIGEMTEYFIRKYKKVVIKSDYAEGESFIYIYK